MKRKTKAQRVFDILKRRPKSGVTNTELNEITFRYGAIIFDLRKDGHVIETKQLNNNGLYRYRMTS